MSWRILQGDVLDHLRELPAESVQCCVTSPPYWGLRDYGAEGQIGMEATPDEHVAKLVEVFREVRRVLRSDGVLWLNYGDAYAAAPNGGQGRNGQLADRSAAASGIREGRGAGVPRGLKPKDMIGLPWRLARALQEPYYTGKIKDERDRIWLAAMIDGEGSICGSRHTRSDGCGRRTNVGIFITNTCNALLDEAHRIWPGSRHVHQKPGTGHLGTREVHRWAVHGADGKSALLAELLPHLIAKRRQAVIAWNFLELVKKGRSRTGKTGPQSVEEKARREVLLSVLSDLNKGIDVEMPTWLADPPSMFEPGWWLRSDCIWHKPNPMCESVRDRPTKAHEYVFLLSKSARYFWDAEAIREEAEYGRRSAFRGGAYVNQGRGQNNGRLNIASPSVTGSDPSAGRNARTVWTINPQPMSDWSENVRLDRVEPDASSDDTMHITSSDCPHHADRPDRVPKAFCDARVAAETSRILCMHARPFRAQNGGIAPTDPTLARWTVRESSGSLLLERSGTATASSTGSRRTGHAPATIGPCNASDGNPCRTPCTEGEPDSPEPSSRIRESSILRADSADPPSAGNDDCSACTSSCCCAFYAIRTEKTSHFATFPEALAERCIKAGSRRGDTVLDPFAGSGTTLAVAERLGRDSLGIELNPAYIAMAERRIRSADPTHPIPLKNGSVQGSLFQA